jgi:hypothetical protein
VSQPRLLPQGHAPDARPEPEWGFVGGVLTPTAACIEARGARGRVAAKAAPTGACARPAAGARARFRGRGLDPDSDLAADNSGRVAAKAAPTGGEPDSRAESGWGSVGGVLTPTAAWIEACGQQRPCRGQGRSHRGMVQTCGRSASGILWEGSSDPDSSLYRSLRTAAAASQPGPLPQGVHTTSAPTKKKAARRPPLRTHSHCCGGGEPSIALVRLPARAVTNTSSAPVPQTAQGVQPGATGGRRAVQPPGACCCVVHASAACERRFTPPRPRQAAVRVAAPAPCRRGCGPCPSPRCAGRRPRRNR